MKIHGNPLLRKTPLRQKTPMKRTAWMQTKGAREKKGPGLAQTVASFLGVDLQHNRKTPTIWRSKEHLRNVAALSCANCNKQGRSQAAHTNLLAAGKGRGIKASDALTFPLCADGFLSVGCHSLLDQGATFDKPTSAAMQVLWLQQTRDRLLALGQWPAEAETDMIRHIGAYLKRCEP